MHVSDAYSGPKFDSMPDSNSDSNSGANVIGEFEVSAPGSHAAPGPVLSAAVLEQESERRASRVAVDPMMAELTTGSSGKSFSELEELPPLKEPLFESPVPEPAEPPLPIAQIDLKKKRRNRGSSRGKSRKRQSIKSSPFRPG